MFVACVGWVGGHSTTTVRYATGSIISKLHLYKNIPLIPLWPGVVLLQFKFMYFGFQEVISECFKCHDKSVSSKNNLRNMIVQNGN